MRLAHVRGRALDEHGAPRSAQTALPIRLPGRDPLLDRRLRCLDDLGPGDRAERCRAPRISQAVRAIGIALWLPVASVTLSGCVTQSASILPEAGPAPAHRVVQIRPCQDRSGFTGRDLGAETTRALTEKVRASGVFEVREDAALALTCDIERFEEGSALKRWVLPGWGATSGQVAVSVWEQPGDRVLATFRAQSSVSAGGLYTIGADQYILGVAVDDIVRQMKAWASGAPPAPPR